MNECWEKYGFPDPAFMTPYLPYIGLVKALNERAELAGTDTITIPDYFSRVPDWGSAMTHFDTALAAVVGNGRFVNPEKYDSLNENSTPGDLAWTFNELLLAGADYIQDNIIYPYTRQGVHLAPVLYAAWLKQRYKMINLLHFRTVSSYCRGVSDMSFPYAYYYYSKQDAFQASLSVAFREGQSFPISPPEGRFYGSSIDLGEKVRYESRFLAIPKWLVYPDLELPQNSDFYLVCKVLNNPETHYFDPMGTGLSLGMNRIKADLNRSFIDLDSIPFPDQWNSMPNYRGGWFCNQYLAYADFGEFLTFKQEDSEE